MAALAADGAPLAAPELLMLLMGISLATRGLPTGAVVRPWLVSAMSSSLGYWLSNT
jgi:hypothetical protein